jgi:chromosome segregation ATPase
MSVNLTKEDLRDRLAKLQRAYDHLERERDHHVKECKRLDQRVDGLTRKLRELGYEPPDYR